MIRKITSDPQNVTVKDVVADYNEKMAIVKDFQRRQVWKKQTIHDYIESVSEGTAVSGIIVADIESGIEASEACGDYAGKERYEKLKDKEKRTVNEDGQNRLKKGLIQFVSNEITFTGTLYDLDHNARQFENVKFEKLPESFQHAFLNSTVLVVTIKNAPFRKLPAIFRKLNAGDALNRTEKRQSLQTPISSWIRSYCEGTFADMWPRFSGCSAQSILRMRDIEWMTQSFMTCNQYTKNRFFRDDDMDWFFELGEGKPMNSVKQYDAAERQRFISILETVQTTVQQQQCVPLSKFIPQRTFWALLVIAEYFYDSNAQYAIHSYDQFYRDVYSIDAHLVTDSKIEQSNRIKTERNKNPHIGDDELSRLVPDNDFYWSQCRRMEAPVQRDARKKTLIEKVEDHIKAGTFLSILAPVALASK